jgi:hypothetical protein
LIIGAITLHIIAYAFLTKNANIPNIIQDISRIFAIIVIYALPVPIISIYAKPLLFLLSKNNID